MASTTVTKRYAKALSDLYPEAKDAAGALDDLRLWAEVLMDNPGFRSIMLHPEISKARKLELVARVHVRPGSRDFIKLLVAKKRLDVLDDVIRDFEGLLDDSRNTVRAEVITAVALDGRLLAEFELQVARLTGKNVRLENVVDPGVVGGVKLVVGDRVLDGTLITKLSEIRREMIRG